MLSLRRTELFGQFMPKLFQRHSEFDLMTGNAKEFWTFKGFSGALMAEWWKTRGSDLSQKIYFFYYYFYYFAWQYIENVFFCQCALRSKVSSTILKYFLLIIVSSASQISFVCHYDSWCGGVDRARSVSHTGFVYMQQQSPSL